MIVMYSDVIGSTGSTGSTESGLVALGNFVQPFSYSKNWLEKHSPASDHRRTHFDIFYKTVLCSRCWGSLSSSRPGSPNAVFQLTLSPLARPRLPSSSPSSRLLCLKTQILPAQRQQCKPFCSAKLRVSPPHFLLVDSTRLDNLWQLVV